MTRKSLLLTLICVCTFAVGARAASRDEILPAGTLLHCTTDEPNFSSKSAQAGDPILCHLGPVSSFGHSVFPRGAMLSGHLQDAKDPGHFVGKGWLQLEFDRIILPGAEVLPLSAKIIATPHLKTDREGKIKGDRARAREPRLGADAAVGATDQVHSFPLWVAATGVVRGAHRVCRAPGS